MNASAQNYFTVSELSVLLVTKTPRTREMPLCLERETPISKGPATLSDAPPGIAGADRASIV